MGTLFRCELKKLLTRRYLWLAAAALAMMVLGPYQRDIRSPKEFQGLRDTYARYEGQIVTDALLIQAHEEYDAYIAAHPDDFQLIDDDGDEPFYSIRYAYRYSTGVWRAYIDIFGLESLESRQQRAAQYRLLLETGMDGGRALTPSERTRYEDFLRTADQPPVIHYMRGWQELTRAYDSRIASLVFILLALAELFPRERSSRMESILLSAAGRRRAVLMKMAAAAALGLAASLLFIAMEASVIFFMYGTGGASLPASVLDPSWPRGWTVGGVYALMIAPLLLAAAASASVIALASALSTHGLWTLPLAGAMTGFQYALPFVFDRAYWYFHYQNPYSTFANYSDYMKLLPTPAYTDPSLLMNSPAFMAIALALSLLVTGLLFSLAPRAYLRPRKI